MTEQNLQEPSMEEILSSIRRILSEDDEDVSVNQEEEINDIDDIEEVNDVFEESVEEVMPEVFETEDFESETETEDVLELTDNMAYKEDAIISQPVANATACSLAQLAKAVSQDRNFALGGSSLTLEMLIREMLKPFLKEWLDANLPQVVERIVKKEIERVVDKMKL